MCSNVGGGGGGSAIANQSMSNVRIIEAQIPGGATLMYHVARGKVYTSNTGLEVQEELPLTPKQVVERLVKNKATVKLVKESEYKKRVDSHKRQREIAEKEATIDWFKPRPRRGWKGH